MTDVVIQHCHWLPSISHTHLYQKKKAPKCHASRTFQSSISGPVPCAWFVVLGNVAGPGFCHRQCLSCVCLNSPTRSLFTLLTHSLQALSLTTGHRVAVRERGCKGYRSSLLTRCRVALTWIFIAVAGCQESFFFFGDILGFAGSLGLLFRERCAASG